VVGQHGERKYLQGSRVGGSAQVGSPNTKFRKYVVGRGYGEQGRNGWS
jgi:hypothetical protein